MSGVQDHRQALRRASSALVRAERAHHAAILDAAAAGMSTVAIARELHISQQAVSKILIKARKQAS